jgi:hypothetical protein
MILSAIREPSRLVLAVVPHRLDRGLDFGNRLPFLAVTWIPCFPSMPLSNGDNGRLTGTHKSKTVFPLLKLKARIVFTPRLAAVS